MGQLTATERRELKSVIVASFKLLRKQLAARTGQVKLDAIEVIDQATQAEVDAYTRETAKVVVRVQKAVDAGEDRILELADQYGIDQGTMWESVLYLPTGRGSTNKVTLSSWTHRRRSNESSRVQSEIEQASLDAEVAIDSQELEMVKTVAIDALESDYARSLLGEIPTPATLVQAPDLKALTG